MVTCNFLMHASGDPVAIATGSDGQVWNINWCRKSTVGFEALPSSGGLV